MRSYPRILGQGSAWSSASVLPLQMVARTGFGRLPEVRLLAAVLEDALQCVVRNAGTGSRMHRRQLRDACEWIFGEGEAEWPFAFENVCGVLGLDTAAVRSRVQEILS